MNYKNYYTAEFRNDLWRFMKSIPDKSKFHDDLQRRQLYTIQYERLTPYRRHLKYLEKERMEYFGVALYFTILTDMVCYSHFRQHYNEFQKLTRYPKFIGDCPGGCHYHHPPENVFSAMNKNMPMDSRLSFAEKFMEAISTMKTEVLDFFSEHLPEIDGERFWYKCMEEFPFTMNQ